MCFGSKGNTTPPPPQKPTTFQYGGTQDSVQRQAAVMKEKGYTNTAGYGSELASNGQPAASAPTPATTGGM